MSNEESEQAPPIEFELESTTSVEELKGGTSGETSLDRKKKHK